MFLMNISSSGWLVYKFLFTFLYLSIWFFLGHNFSCLFLPCFSFFLTYSFLTHLGELNRSPQNQIPSYSQWVEAMMRKELKQVCIPGPLIVGAGPAGLAAAACLKKRGVPSLILEKENCIVSLWNLKTYDRLRLHLPKKFCELPYMKFPSDFPAYPTKQQFISYLEDYAKSFSIEPMFGQEVRWTKYDKRMRLWQVQAKEWRFLCRWLIVATGENAEPVVPEIAGISNFEGRLLHTSIYKNGADFKGGKVLVVGCGNSGMEVSLDLCNAGAHVSLVVRDKLHVLPREIFGISAFALSMWLLKWFPVRFVDRLLLLCSRMILGDTGQIGIKRPEFGPLHLKNATGKTPVLDVGAVAKIRSREVKVVCGIRRFTTKGVEFVNGEVQDFDSVILATGYRSNVSSWLKEDNLFSQKDGYPKNPFPNNWKGEDGLYSVGFTRRGLYGASIDAQRVAEDIARQWNSHMKHCILTYRPIYTSSFEEENDSQACDS